MSILVPMKNLLIVLLTIPFWCNANNVSDSLYNFIQTTESDTSKIIAYEQLAIFYRKENPDTAYYFNSQAIALAKNHKEKKWLAEAYREHALTAQSIGNYPLAVDYYKKAQKVHLELKNKNGIAEGYNDIGVAYYYSGNYEKAGEHFKKAGKIRIDIGDSLGAGQSYNNTGIMYDIAGNPTEALKLYLQALNIYENLKDTSMTIGTLSNIGLIYSGQKNYHEAIKIYERQKNEAQTIGDQKQYGISLTSLGTAYDYLGEYEKARKLFFEALEILIELGDKPMIAQCYNNLSVNFELTGDDDKSLEYALKSIKLKKEIGAHGKLAISQIAAAKIYNKKGNYSQALALYQDALSNAQETGYVDYTIKAHKGLSLTYENLKTFDKAYYHQSQYLALNDSVTNTKNTALINEMEKKYQNERKQQEIELLNKTNALKDVKLAKADEENKRKSLQLYGSLGLGVILLTLVLIIFKSSQQRKKHNKLLHQKNTEITYQKEVLEEKNKEISDSIKYAKRIQEAILPSRYSISDNLKNGFVFFKPKDIVSGDFYWLENLSNPSNKEAIVYFAAADCTGHGVPGALVSVVCSNALSKALLEEHISDTGKLLDRTRELVVKRFEKSEEDVKDGMDISLCKLDLTNFQNNSGKAILQWSGANNPLWIIRNNELLEYKPDKQPIGKTDNPRPFTTHTINLTKNDTLYIFTDGYQDQFGGEKGKKFKTSQLKQLLLSLQENTMSEQKELLNEAFDKWKGNEEQVDDVCIIGVRV